MICNIELNTQSIHSAIRKLTEYYQDLNLKCDELSHEVCNTGLELLPLNGAPIDVSAHYGIEHEGYGTSRLVAEGEQLPFLEFGTGRVGDGTYLGDLPDEWGYDLRRSPWAHDPKEPWKWWYLDDEGHRHKTAGLKARSFMAKTADDMRESIQSAAIEVFSR